MEEVISLLERFVLNFEDELNEEQLNYIKAILETAKGVNYYGKMCWRSFEEFGTIIRVQTKRMWTLRMGIIFCLRKNNKWFVHYNRYFKILLRRIIKGANDETQIDGKTGD